jgi:hypothetical protein
MVTCRASPRENRPINVIDFPAVESFAKNLSCPFVTHHATGMDHANVRSGDIGINDVIAGPI